MKNYLRILVSLLSFSTKHYIEYRLTTIGYLFTSLISFALAIFFVQTFFTFSSSLNGWDKIQALLLTGVCRVVLSIVALLFSKSINRMPEYIRMGELDILLTKPVNSQFLLSFRHIKIYDLINILSGIMVIFYAINKSGPIPLIYYLTLGVGLIFSVITLYSIYFIIATISIWLVKFNAFAEVFEVVMRPLAIPIDILGKEMSFILTFIIPLGFIVTIPVKIFLGLTSPFFMIGEILIALSFLLISINFWKFALRYYTSASS